MVPPLADQVTLGLKAPVPLTVAVQVDNCPVCTDAGLHVAVTEVTLPAAATVMVVVPVFVESCVEVAVIVTCVLKGTVAAVNRPEAALIVPPVFAVQKTPELKLPVPETVAVHWLVCCDVIDVGEQLAPTKVIVEVVVPLLPPHADSSARQNTPARIPRIRTPAPLLDLSDIYALGHHRRHISPAMEVACVSTLLKYETGSFYGNRTVSMTLLRCYCLFHRLEVGSEDLLEIRLKRTLPCDTKDSPFLRDKFAHRLSSGSLYFVLNILLRGDAAQRPLHASFVNLDSCDVVAQRRPRRKSKRQQNAGEQPANGLSVRKSKGSRSIHDLSFDGFS
jgi:hypothetical protein